MLYTRISTLAQSLELASPSHPHKVHFWIRLCSPTSLSFLNGQDDLYPGLRTSVSSVRTFRITPRVLRRPKHLRPVCDLAGFFSKGLGHVNNTFCLFRITCIEVLNIRYSVRPVRTFDGDTRDSPQRLIYSFLPPPSLIFESSLSISTPRPQTCRLFSHPKSPAPRIATIRCVLLQLPLAPLTWAVQGRGGRDAFGKRKYGPEKRKVCHLGITSFTVHPIL